MKPIEGWDKVEPVIGNGSPPLPAGGYPCRIIVARHEMSKKGKWMLRLAVDIAEGEHSGFFYKQYESRRKRNTDANWPAAGMYYQLTDGDSVGRFKGMILTLQESNPGWTWDWDENKLVGCKFGGLFREEEYLGNDGKVHSNTKCISILPLEGIKDAPVPEKKCLKPHELAMTQQYISDSDIPF